MSVRLRVLGPGAPAVVAEIVTVELPVGVLFAVAIDNVTVTGVPELGLTVAEGKKLHVAPVGSPEQVSVTA